MSSTVDTMDYRRAIDKILEQSKDYDGELICDMKFRLYGRVNEFASTIKEGDNILKACLEFVLNMQDDDVFPGALKRAAWELLSAKYKL